MANADITAIFAASEDSPISAADAERVFAAAYDEIKQLAVHRMRHERADHTLQPTALVNEAYLKLVDTKGVRAESRSQFVAIAANAMRQVLIDHSRRRDAEKRGGGWQRVLLEGVDSEGALMSKDTAIDSLELEEALKRLAARHARMAEGVEMRVYGGLTGKEVAQAQGISRKTAVDDWRFACLWLRAVLAGEDPP